MEFLPGSLSTSVQICWILTSLPLPCSQGLTTVYYQTVGFSLTRYVRMASWGNLISISLILSKVQHLFLRSKDTCVFFFPRSVNPFLNVSIFNRWQGNGQMAFEYTVAKCSPRARSHDLCFMPITSLTLADTWAHTSAPPSVGMSK